MMCCCTSSVLRLFNKGRYDMILAAAAGNKVISGYRQSSSLSLATHHCRK